MDMSEAHYETDNSNGNLIVNYIPTTMTEEQLQLLFSKFGQLESVKIVREKGTRKSMGYGFVKYISGADAQRAVAQLNGTKIENKTLKVAIARPVGSGPKSNNLYVAGLEPHVTNEELQTIFQAYGKVAEAKVLVDPANKQGRGVGFVRFDSDEEAQAAITGLHGVTLPSSSKPLVVRVAEEKKDKRQPIAGMLGGMGRGANMRYSPMGMYAPSVYAQYGAAAYGGAPYGAAAGYPQAAAGIYGQQAYGAGAQASNTGNIPGTYCLFVYNLPPETDENYLYQLFGPYGAIVNVKVMRDMASNMCKGFGFVNMAKLEEAQTAIAALNGAQIGHKTLQVSFKQNN